jgi:hypothetical protein
MKYAIMNDLTYDKLRNQIAETLSARTKEFHKAVAEISGNFRSLGFESAVWYPEKIHTANLGGIDADSYIGYSRVEGRWGLIVRTVEYDRESHAFVNQRVFTIESCGNIEIMVNALRKVPELMHCLSQAAEHQIKTLYQLGEEFEELRRPGCKFCQDR